MAVVLRQEGENGVLVKKSYRDGHYGGFGFDVMGGYLEKY